METPVQPLGSMRERPATDRRLRRRTTRLPIWSALFLVAACAPSGSAPVPPEPRPHTTVPVGPAVSAEHPRGLPPIDTLLIRAHTRVLSHDSLGGRGTGTAGSLSAALYIAAQLESIGARPLARATAGTPSPFLIPVPLGRADVSEATIRLRSDDQDVLFRHGEGFLVGRVGRAGLRAAEGAVERISADSARVRAGNWLVLDASLGEAALRWLPAWRNRGVVGIIVRLPNDAALEAWRGQLGDVRWQLLEGESDAVWQPDLPVLLASPTLVERLTDPGIRLSFDPRARTDSLLAYNVAGYIAGHDATRSSERVFMTAHYDHLGIVRDGGGDSIYNGFSDNAAGVAMLLAVAASAVEFRPARSLVFLFPTAEEVGLLGSIHFVRTQAAEPPHAVVNVDAGAPPAPPTRWRLAAASRSRAIDVAARVVEDHGWVQRSDAGSPNSDHWPFVQRGVPAVFLIPDGGYEGVSEEDAARLSARWDHYHQPDDEWSPDFPFSGLGRYAGLARDIAWTFANETGRAR